MSYGSYEDSPNTGAKEGDSQENVDSSNSLPTGAPPVTDPSYAQWYYNWYNQAGQNSTANTASSESADQHEQYSKYYEQYYAQQNPENEGKS